MKTIIFVLSILALLMSSTFAQTDNHSSGNNAGVNITTGDNNSFFGSSAGNDTTTGSRNSFFGREAGRYNTSGNNNTFIGHAAGKNNTDAHSNTFIGQWSGTNTTTGKSNTFVGASSGKANLTGNYNVFIGLYSGFKNTSSNNNTFLGYSSGQENTTGANNTYLGFYSGYNNITGSNNVFLGFKAGHDETGSNKLYIANSLTSTPLIYGEFDNSKLQVNGELRVTNGILANKVTVKLQTNWPDYVFAQDYQLPSLAEVEKHIAEKNHLPGIPSAKDIEKNGLALDEIVTKQMEKIEELTLYLIQKEKEIEKLKLEAKSKTETLNTILDRLNDLEKAAQK